MTPFATDVSSKDLIDTLRSALVVLDEGLRVKSANRSFYALFQVQQAETEGRLIYDLGNRQWDIPALRELLERIIPRDEAIEGYEVDHHFEGIGRRTLLLNARKVYRPADHTMSLLLAIDDITAEREASRDSERAWRLAQTIVDTVRDPLVILEGDMTVASVNRAFLGLFGVTEGQVVGRQLKDLGEGQWDVSALGVLLAKVVPDEAAFDG
ncbi:MAG TPA: PAS domain-containing protein, partial [Caulobacter sp.]|nr:PAS domain-containing protein [Caulobacter sp.]